jgi:hypothetical protein
MNMRSPSLLAAFAPEALLLRSTASAKHPRKRIK